MKKILEWLKGPKSDFALFAIFLILLNIVGYNAFLRFDFTSQKAYSLSKDSKELVKNVSEPLNVKVFFDDKLPPPYNNVKQYVNDILKEYEGSGNKNFTVSFMDMSKDENRQLALDYGLQQIQIQEVKNNEIGFKQAYMGLVITYGDVSEIINPITSSNGFEYTLTSRLTKMINMADTLSGFNEDEKVTLTLYYSDVLNELGISGSRELKKIVEDAFNNVNEKNQGRLEFIVQDPLTSTINELCNVYGVQEINYKENGELKQAAFGLVLSHDDKFYSLPIFIKNSLFGYVIAGLDNIEESINDGLESLLSNVKEVGYITGHEELDNENPNEAGNFGKIVSSLYEFINIDLMKENIPSGINTIVINGPKTDYSEEELYKIDQFIMRGGNVLFFVDSVIFSEESAQSGGSPFIQNPNSLDKLLENYGVKRNLDVVMDKNCYEDYNPQMGKIGLNWAPVLQKDQLAQNHPITNNLGYVVMLQNGSLDIKDALNNEKIETTVLAKSSEEAWTEDSDIILHPYYISEPSDPSVYKEENLAVLLEGTFNSAFSEQVVMTEYDEEGNVIELEENDNLSTNSHLNESIRPGKIFVTSSSSITTPQVIDEKGDTPIAMFLMNIVDYMNGNEELCEMRTKNLDVHTLTIKSMKAANFWKILNQFGLALIFVLVGFIVWRKRENRRRLINEKYNPNDTRTIKNYKIRKGENITFEDPSLISENESVTKDAEDTAVTDEDSPKIEKKEEEEKQND